MKQRIINKTLAVAIILLFVGVGIQPAIATVQNTSKSTSTGNTLYVDGTGPGNYSKIQDAIDNASDGDTIFVYNGIYYENIVINKTINLIGEDKNTTIIDGSNKSTVVYIVSPKVTIRNFKIQNSSHNYSFEDCGIFINSDNNTISENIISYNDIGVSGNGFIGSISDNKICNNVITENKKYGVCLLAKSWNNSISNNIISYNREGIYLFGQHDSKSLKNFVCNNTIKYNFETGISLFFAFENIISFNNISDNIIGMGISNSDNNFVKNCHIFDNEIDGISIGTSVNNTIRNNIISNSSRYGIYLYNCSLSGESLNNKIIRNEISNHKFGVFLKDGSNENLFYKNVFKDNLDYGAYFDINTKNKNRLFRNYWERPRILPKVIFGRINDKYIWFALDLRPALIEYDIGI